MPAALWPAPRTVTGIPVFRASFTEAATSAVPVQHTIIAGRLSIIALCILRSASYFGFVGNHGTSWPAGGNAVHVALIRTRCQRPWSSQPRLRSFDSRAAWIQQND